MPRQRRERGKRRSGELTWDEQAELLWGAYGGRSAFSSAADGRAAWRAHRDALEALCLPGTVPAAEEVYGA